MYLLPGLKGSFKAQFCLLSECHSLWHAHRHCLHHSKQHCWYSQADDFSHAIHKAHFKRHLEIKGRILPFAWVPVPLALPTPLIAALGALKVGVPFLQGCHTLTVWLRALHQAPIPAAHKRNLLHCQNASSSGMPSLLNMHAFDQGHLKKCCTAYAIKRVTTAQNSILDKCFLLPRIP